MIKRQVGAPVACDQRRKPPNAGQAMPPQSAVQADSHEDLQVCSAAVQADPHADLQAYRASGTTSNLQLKSFAIKGPGKKVSEQL